ncbi:MAG: DUF5671 domain-containing protein [Anaerolineae bacterium]
MLTVRRLYFYGVAAISLIAVTWAVIGLIRLILSEGIGQGQIFELATLMAAIIVGLPIFLFHWWMAQRYAAQEPEERASLVRRFYLYGVMLAGAVPVFNNLYLLVDRALVALVGGLQIDELSVGERLAVVIVWGIVWVYLWRQVQTDNRLLTLEAPHRTIRRLYFLLLTAGGLAMVTLGTFGLLQTLLQLSNTALWRTPIADYCAQILAGLGIWVGHWWFLQQAVAGGYPAEERSVLRKVYLYLAVFVYSVMAIFGLSTVLKRLIELALGAPPSTEPLLSQLSVPLPLMIVGGVWWAYHWQMVQHDAARAPEAPRQASVRRIYAYLVAAIGLAALLTGLVGLIHTIIDLLTTPSSIGLDYYRSQVAVFSAMMLVGAPVWLWPWRKMQGLAVTPPTPPSPPLAEGAQSEGGGVEGGVGERRSTARKIYLYLYVFLASLAIFGSAGWFVYHILTALLGADLPTDFMTQVLDALVITLLAVGVWLYHGWAIRQDGKLAQADQSRRLADISVVVIDGGEGQLGQAIVRQLHQDLPGLQLQPVGVTPQAVAAMQGDSVSSALQEGLAGAHYIIGSWQSLTAAEVGPLVAASGALKLLIPLTEPKWAWAGVRPQSPEAYARQAAFGLKQAIAGEEVGPAGEWGIGTVVVVVLGVILFLIVLGGVIGLAGAIF